MRRLLDNIKKIMARHGCELYGFADMRGLTPRELSRFDRAISFALQMDPKVMAGLDQGPTAVYTALYQKVNKRLDALGAELVRQLEWKGHGARQIPASFIIDLENNIGEFPHKTAATRAGLGWIGRHCQLVTMRHGPWVRLGTVFTEAPLPPSAPREESGCGRCMKCVEACPARALSGAQWHAGLERAAMFDVNACDIYKKEHFADYQDGDICGICTGACPVGQKQLRRA